MTALLYGDPDPSLRWRAAVELDGASPDGDDEVRAWRREVDRSPALASLVARLGALRDQPQAAAYVLCQLAFLGYRDGAAVDEAVEAIFALQLPDGSWPVWREDVEPASPEPAAARGGRRRGKVPAELPHAESYRMITMQTVLPLRGIAAAGFATDPRAERGYEWLLRERLRDGSWTGSHKADLGTDGRSSGEDPAYRKLDPGEGCRSATTGAAACLALHPTRRSSDAARTAVDHLLHQPIRRDAALGWEVSRLVGFERAGGRFTFYVTHDLAFVLDLASRCGFSAEDDNVRALLDHVVARRGPYGLWEHPVHPQLSRWLTFELESTLRRLAGGEWIGSSEPGPRSGSGRPRRRH